MSNLASAARLVYELRALGTACQKQGDLYRAEQHYRLALSLYESSFPEEHEDAVLCLMGLIHVLEAQGNQAEASQLEHTLAVLNARRRAAS